MLDLIKNFFTDKTAQTTKSSENTLDANVALCVLLLEAAHVDGECSSEEKEHVVSTLTTECGVPREKIDELIASGYQERKESVDLFRFTRHMNNSLSKEEKIAAMEAVWRIIHIDGRLEAHEDHFAHKLANLLRLTHKELIAAKVNARTQLV